MFQWLARNSDVVNKYSEKKKSWILLSIFSDQTVRENKACHKCGKVDARKSPMTLLVRALGGLVESALPTGAKATLLRQLQAGVCVLILSRLASTGIPG